MDETKYVETGQPCKLEYLHNKMPFSWRNFYVESVLQVRKEGNGHWRKDNTLLTTKKREKCTPFISRNKRFGNVTGQKTEKEDFSLPPLLNSLFVKFALWFLDIHQRHDLWKK